MLFWNSLALGAQKERKKESEVAQLCPTLCDPMNCSLPGSSVHGDSPGKHTGEDGHALLQGIFPTRGSNPGLPRCRQTLYRLSSQGSPGSTRQSSKPAWEEGHSLRADHWSLRACENCRAGEWYVLRSRASYRGHGGRWFSPSLHILSIGFRWKNYSLFLLPHTLDLDPMLFARTTATE